MSKKEKKKVKIQAEEPVVLDIPEDEIWTYQIEGLAAPHVNKPYKHYRLKKVVFTLIIIVAVSLSMYFSIRSATSEVFEYKENKTGYTFSKFSNNGFITELDIDYVSNIKYKDGDEKNADEESDFDVVKDKDKKITEVGQYVLNCEGKVQVINISADVTSIDPKAFYSCWALQQIEVDENNPNYCDIDGVLYSKDKKTVICRPCDHDTYLAEKYGYASYDKDGNRVEPNADDLYYKQRYYYRNVVNADAGYADVAEVEKYFKNEDNLKALEEYFKTDDAQEYKGIAETIKDIFKSIKNIFVKEEEKQEPKTNIDKLNEYFADENNYNKYKEQYFNPYYEKYEKDVLTYVVPSSVTVIGDLCFNYANMVNIYLPEGLKRIETLGLFEIPRLENIYTYKNEGITDPHFISQEELGEVYFSLPESLIYIGSDALSYNRALRYIYIPQNVKYIGHHAFWDDVYKETIEVEENGEKKKIKVLKGVAQINVAVSEEEFKSVEKGDSWRPKYDSILFKKNVKVVYNAERITEQPPAESPLE